MAVRGLGIATFIERLKAGFVEDGAGAAPDLWQGQGDWGRAGLISTLLHSGLFDVSPRLDPRTRHYDVVHFACNVGSLVPGPGSVLTVHDLMHRRNVRGRARVLGALLERSVTRAGRVVAVSGRTGTALVDAFPALAGRVEVIPHGMRRLAVLPAPREHILAFGGASDPRKRTGLMVAIFRAYRAAAGSSALPLVVLARAGLTPAQRTELLSLGSRIVDSASGSEVDGLMQRAAALLYTTTEEGFGLPVLEAAECGTPVVVDAEARMAEEVVGAHCVQVTGQELDAWVAALRQAISVGPVEAALDLPDWPSVARAYRHLYGQVVNL